MRRASPAPAPGRIRIIGGRLRGSKLDVPASPGLRPTPDRIRETLFNWLMPVIEGARCLDLFAGSGANGIEAWSRGASAVTLVERDAALARHLAANVARLKLADADVVCSDAMDYLRRTPQTFDVVFMDPPFALDIATRAANLLEQAGWLAPSAWIHVELPADATAAMPANWRVHRQGRAGALGYTLYRREAVAKPLHWANDKGGAT